MMLLPRKNDFNLLDDIFGDFNYTENKVMKTDIKENDNEYLLKIDLPGYDKENIKISIDDGYLTINATINKESNEDGNYVRRERYYGECSRSFYVGDNVLTEDINASFKNGILNVSIPKKEDNISKEKHYVEIGD